MSRSDTRERFLQTASRLLSERGYSATAMGDIVSESGSPKGSLYFHFPGGKEELAALALTRAGDEMCELIRSALSSSKTLEEALKTVFALFMGELEGTNFRAGCPMGKIAAEAPESTRICAVVADAFQQWHALLKQRLVEAGVRSRRADELAEFILAVYEGGVVLAKAKKTTKPLETALREIIHLLRQENVR